MENLKQFFKSRTNRVSLLITLLGLIELQFSMFEKFLGEWYGITFIVFSVVMSILRQITTKPVSEK